VIRSLVYIRLPDRSLDERGYTVAKAFRDAHPASVGMSQPQLKEAFRDQYLLLMIDQGRAVRALPGLLPPDPAARKEAMAAIRSVVTASGKLSEEGARRLDEAVAIFEASQPEAPQAADKAVGQQGTSSTAVDRKAGADV
jgi:hypothetical protein